MSIALVGMSGCGKTTVMELYQKKYGEQVYDTDSFIEARHGRISEIFSNFGEEYFRGLETQAIKEICGYGDCAMLSTGGGAVLREENVKLLKSFGKVVYLRAQLPTLLSRLAGDASRPLLSGDRAQKLAKLLSERARVYERVADKTVDTDGLTPEQVLGEILG